MGGQLTTFSAAGGGVAVLATGTALYRASIIRDDKACMDGLCNDFWPPPSWLFPFIRPVKLDSGDDTFLSRWIQQRGFDVVIQGVDEAGCFHPVKTDRHFAGQLLRWERSTVQTFVRSMEGPYGSELRQTRPFLWRKMAERLMRPWLTIMALWAWQDLLRHHPLAAWVSPSPVLQVTSH